MGGEGGLHETGIRLFSSAADDWTRSFPLTKIPHFKDPEGLWAQSVLACPSSAAVSKTSNCCTSNAACKKTGNESTGE